MRATKLDGCTGARMHMHVWLEQHLGHSRRGHVVMGVMNPTGTLAVWTRVVFGGACARAETTNPGAGEWRSSGEIAGWARRGCVSLCVVDSLEIPQNVRGRCLPPRPSWGARKHPSALPSFASPSCLPRRCDAPLICTCGARSSTACPPALPRRTECLTHASAFPIRYQFAGLAGDHVPDS